MRFPVFGGNLAHNFIETVCADSFYSFGLVKFVYRDPFVLEGEEEKEHLANFLFLPMRLFLSLAQLKSLSFNLDHEVKLSWSKPSLCLFVLVLRACLDTSIFLPLPLILLLKQLDLPLLPVDNFTAYF